MLTLNNNKVIFISLAVLIFAIHQIMFLSYLNIGSFHFDYQSALSRLIFGKIWFLKNGLTVPWFTPHICCGAPFFSNPQSEFYSPIQFLFLFLKPLTTFKVIFFIYSFLGYLGSFLILRRIFKLTNNAALIGSTIFLFNHYFAFHYLSGHIGWGLFSIIPIFFYISAISLDQTNKKYSFFLITSSALIFAIMMHSGGTRIIMEILVSIFFLTLLHLINYKNYKIILYIAVSVLIGLLISASKIYAAWSFVEGLSRNVAPIYFDSIWKFISVFFDFFFLSPRESIENDVGSISAMLSIEELSFNVTILPLVIFIIYLRNFPKITNDKFKLTFSYILLTSVFILILLNFSNTALGSVVRKIPFITNDWISFRMLAPLIILFSILTPMMFDKISFKKNDILTIFFLSIIIIQNLSFDRNKLYNVFAHTDLKDLLNYDVSQSNVNNYNINRILTILDKDSKVDGPKQHDFFLENESIQFCYFSVFGYDLEALKPIVKPLIFNHHETWIIKPEFSNDQSFNQTMNVYKGDPFFERNGNLNFINPSCYLNPEENNCKDNFLFKASNKQELNKFLNYKPFEFKQLKLQIIFNYLSLITFIFSLISFFYFLLEIKKTPSKKI
mgnify:CR=1 FL=1